MEDRTLEQVLADANAAWNKDQVGKQIDRFTSAHKTHFIFGYLQSAYIDLYNSKKRKKNIHNSLITNKMLQETTEVQELKIFCSYTEIS
jgi:hypothetical protein